MMVERKVTGRATLHEMFSTLLENHDIYTVSVESDEGMVTLARGVFHYYLWAGTVEDGYKLRTIKGWSMAEQAYIGKVIDAQLGAN
jgi:hypothetical protein